MKRVSDKKRRAPRRAAERHEDCHGIPFDEHRFHLPAERHRWPAARLVVDPGVCAEMHRRFAVCWNCARPGVEAHHLFEGSRGKSDELTLIVMLCAECHGQRQASIPPLGRLLWLKWAHDRQNTDWVRLALCAKRYLPDLICEGE